MVHFTVEVVYDDDDDDDGNGNGTDDDYNVRANKRPKRNMKRTHSRGIHDIFSDATWIEW